MKEVNQVKKSYLIQGIEPTLWKNFKTACAWYEISMRDIFIKHMQNTVSDYMDDKKLHYVPIKDTKKGGKNT